MTTTPKDLPHLSPLPSSAVVLGAIVRALSLADSDVTSLEVAGFLKSRTARDAFAGVRPTPETLQEICNWCAKGLLECQFIPFHRMASLIAANESAFDNQVENVKGALEEQMQNNGDVESSCPEFKQLKLSHDRLRKPHGLLSAFLQGTCAVVDKFAGRASQLAGVFEYKAIAQEAALRLALPENAIRFAAMLLLAGEKAPVDAVPVWATPKGIEGFVRSQFLERLPIEKRPTRDSLSATLSVGEATVDRWLARIGSEIPSWDNIGKLCCEIAKLSPDLDESNLWATTGRILAAWRICEALAESLGWSTVGRLARAFCRMTARSMSIIRKHLSIEGALADSKADILQEMMFCIDSDTGDQLLGVLRQAEEDSVWRADLNAIQSGREWERFEQWIRAARSKPVCDEFAAEKRLTSDDSARFWELSFKKILSEDLPILARIGKLPGGGSNLRIAALFLKAQNEYAAGRFSIATIFYRQALDLDESNADTWYRLGTSLWQCGRFDEGEAACWRAFQLKPDWDLPYVEIAIIKCRLRQFDSALQHLESPPATLPQSIDQMTWFYVNNLALVRFGCQAWESALEACLETISRRQDLGRMHDQAAYCLYVLGDLRAAGFAKQAKALGYSQTYDLAKLGSFRKK